MPHPSHSQTIRLPDPWYERVLALLERRGMIVLLSFIAVLLLVWAIASTGQRYQMSDHFMILDTHTGAVGVIGEAPRIWPKK